jgi:hypothetical protein
MCTLGTYSQRWSGRLDVRPILRPETAAVSCSFPSSGFRPVYRQPSSGRRHHAPTSPLYPWKYRSTAAPVSVRVVVSRPPAVNFHVGVRNPSALSFGRSLSSGPTTRPLEQRAVCTHAHPVRTFVTDCGRCVAECVPHAGSPSSSRSKSRTPPFAQFFRCYSTFFWICFYEHPSPSSNEQPVHHGYSAMVSTDGLASCSPCPAGL